MRAEEKACKLGSPTQSRRHFSRPRLAASARTIADEGARASQLWSVMATRARGRFYDKQAGKYHLRLSEPSCLAWCHPSLHHLTAISLPVDVNNVKGGFAGKVFAREIRPLGVRPAAASRQSVRPIPFPDQTSLKIALPSIWSRRRTCDVCIVSGVMARTLKVKIVIRGVDDLCRETNGKTHDVQDVSKVFFSLKENFIGKRKEK